MTMTLEFMPINGWREHHDTREIDNNWSQLMSLGRGFPDDINSALVKLRAMRRNHLFPIIIFCRWGRHLQLDHTGRSTSWSSEVWQVKNTQSGWRFHHRENTVRFLMLWLVVRAMQQTIVSIFWMLQSCGLHHRLRFVDIRLKTTKQQDFLSVEGRRNNQPEQILLVTKLPWSMAPRALLWPTDEVHEETVAQEVVWGCNKPEYPASPYKRQDKTKRTFFCMFEVYSQETNWPHTKKKRKKRKKKEIRFERDWRPDHVIMRKRFVLLRQNFGDLKQHVVRQYVSEKHKTATC